MRVSKHVGETQYNIHTRNGANESLSGERAEKEHTDYKTLPGGRARVIRTGFCSALEVLTWLKKKKMVA